jgi:hypothetical protein
MRLRKLVRALLQPQGERAIVPALPRMAGNIRFRLGLFDIYRGRPFATPDQQRFEALFAKLRPTVLSS